MLQEFNPKNKDLQVYIDGELYHRDEAKVSVFDSVVQGGDAVWEGLRIYDGRIFCFDEHITRLQESAKSMAFTDVPTKAELKEAVVKTLKANNMRDGVHIRLTLTRGRKITSGMDPRLNQFGPTLIVLAEYKMPVYDHGGVRLVCSNIRRNSPQTIDSKIHHNNLINNILAKIEANYAGVDAAIMLDLYGYVSEANGTNMFMIKNGVLLTPHADSCLPGITRKLVLQIAEELEIPALEKNISITEFYNADEAFITGTMGELTPIVEIDGRKINQQSDGLMKKIGKNFRAKTEKLGEPI